eukprot:g1412.t1
MARVLLVTLFLPTFAWSTEGPQAYRQQESPVPRSTPYMNVAPLNRHIFAGNVLKWIVLFCPKWFQPCQKLEPLFEDLAKTWQTKLNVDSSFTHLRFAQVDCAADKVLCNEQHVTTYPFVAVYRGGSQLYKTGINWKKNMQTLGLQRCPSELLATKKFLGELYEHRAVDVILTLAALVASLRFMKGSFSNPPGLSHDSKADPREPMPFVKNMEAQLKDADSKHHECCKVIAEHKTLEAELLKVRGALRMDGDHLGSIKLFETSLVAPFAAYSGLEQWRHRLFCTGRCLRQPQGVVYCFSMAQMWEVVGGADKGGIIVREDLDLNSPALSERLATGAQGEPSSGSDAEAVVAEKELSKEEEEAFEQYVGKFGENRAGEAPGYNRQAFPWTAGQPLKKATPKEAIEAVLEANRPKKTYQPPLTEVDSEGEEVPLCTRCSMPVGQFAYEGRQGIRSCVHAECMAQVLVEDAQRHEDRRTTWEVEKKLKSRNEYEIGWRPDSVPQNAHLAERMGCNTPAPGLCCLVLDEASRTVKVAPTLEPAAAVNLEYLLLALKVRKTAKREPLFSLDPVDHQNLEKTPQKKVYEPSWLAGTSVGDVMFQADYFLKELALGEYTMPVAGMMSVFDWSELSAAERDRDWSGREWFVVRKAEVRMAMDQTLIPVVKMGVEAREQVLTKGGLEDAAVTAATHPLKKFADAFSRNFDLIAERRSVVFHLRELAKASVMAKHLVDSNIRVNSTWYQLADEIVKGTAPEAHPQIPQLWNMRGNSRIQLKNGRLIDMLTGGQRKLHAIYGGVEFGLDRFELAQRHAMQGQAGMQLGQSGRPMFMPQRIQIGQQAQVPSMPQGVDLNLDKFNLSNIERFASHLPACSGTSDSLATKVTLGKAFLKSLRERKYPGLKQEYEEVLLKVFESPECDRSQEGDAFIPPDPSMEYTGRIRSLVNEEKLLLERRQMHFFDKAFQVGNAGPDFPRSWTSRIQVEKDGAKTDVSQRKMLTKVDFDPAFASVLANDILPTAAPEFKKDTEDGSTFRIYQIGSLEVRTTQMKFGQEKVGAMFSSGAPAWELKSKATVLAEDEKLQECKVFIEATDGPAQGHQPHHFYLVFKTVQQNVIVIEQLANGSRSWAVNPTNLEDRNSLAKQLFTAVCTEGATVHALKMELESRDGRIRYELIEGSGPAIGWVTPNLRGKDCSGVSAEWKLLQSEAEQELLAKKGEEVQVTKRSGRSAFSQWASAKEDCQELAQPEEMPVVVSAEPDGLEAKTGLTERRAARLDLGQNRLRKSWARNLPPMSRKP